MKRKVFTFIVFLAFLLAPNLKDLKANVWYFWRYRTASNCSQLTDGRAQDLCYQSDGRIFKCVPDADNICNTPSEWVEIGYLRTESDPVFSSVDTEAELESHLTDVTDIYTNNDGNLIDDDLSDNSINDLSDVDTTGWAEGKLLKFDASGKLVVGTDKVDDADSSPTNELQNIFQKVSDGTNVATADSTTDTLTFEAGTGISISVDESNDKVTITNTGDNDPSNDLTTSTSFGGDISGTYNSISVNKIKGKTVDDSAIGDGKVLKYNAGTGNIEYAVDDDVPEAGDFGNAADLDANGNILAGAVGSNEVADSSIAEVDLDINNDPTDGYYLRWNDTAGKMEWASVSGAGGDITAVGNVTSGDAFTADGSGNVLYFEGPTADAYETILQGQDVSSDITVNLPTSSGTLLTKQQIDTESEFESLLFSVVTPSENNDTLDDLSDNKLSDLSDVGTITYTAGQYLRADGTSYVSSSIQDGDLPDTMTRDSEWDTIGEIETATGVNIIVDTEIDTSAELASIVTDETGSGALVFGTSPTFTTDIATPKVKNSGDITIDATSSSANTTITVTNSDATYVANLAVEGTITEGGNGVLNTSELDTEAELESLLTDVTNVYTNNDGALTDDDLSDNSIGDLSDVNTTGVGDGKVLKYNAGTSKWEVADDADTTYSAGTGLSLSGTTFSLSHLGLESLTDPNANRLYYWNDANNKTEWLDYSNWDTDASNDLTTSTTFDGDVSGTYNNLQLKSGTIQNSDIADNTIEESKLHIYNSPTDGYYLKWDATNGMMWAEGTGSGGSGDITAVGDVTTGDAFTENGGGNVLYFEGATADDYETKLQGQDVTLDITVNLPSSSGTLVNKEQIDTESEFESLLFSVFTPSDGSLSDDDLSDNSINDLSDVDKSGWAEGKVLKFDSSGNLVVGTDNVNDADADASNELQNIFQNITDGSNTATADSTTDTFTLEGGSGISVTVDATNDKATIENTGDTDPNDDLTTSTNFSGDISGTYNNISVNKIKGKEVDDSNIGNDKVLKYNSATGKIEYQNDKDTTYTADGEGIELSGTQFSLELDGTTLSKSASGLKVNSITSSEIADGTITNADIADDTISEAKLDIYNAPTDGYYLKYDATNGMMWAAVSGGGSGDITAVGNVTSGDAFTPDGGGNELYFEGATADTYEIKLTAQDPTADYTITLPAATGTVELQENIDTEAELESRLTDVTNVYTNNDGSLSDDDLSDNTTDDLAEGTTNKYCTLTNIQSACSNDFHNIGGTDDDQPDDDSEVPDILSLTKVPNLTTNGFIKTSNGDGTLTIDTNTYLTSESDPVWTSDKTDYYTKTNLQTSGEASVHWDNLTNKPENLDTDKTDDLTTSTSFNGDVSGTYDNLQIQSGTIIDGDINANADVRVAAIEIIIDGGDNAITTGVKADVEVPFNCTILQATALADQTGSIQVDIWKDTYANFPPTDADSITGSNPISISSSNKSQDSTLSGWTTTISAGDILRFNVDSCSSIKRCTISLKVRKD